MTQEHQAPDLSQVYDRYGPMLYRLALGQLQRTQDAEDVVQDAFLRYLRAGRTFQEEEHRKAWLLRVAVNLCRDCQRRQKTRRAFSLEEVAHLPQPSCREEIFCLMEALWALPEKYRGAIQLHDLEGLTVQETAKALGVTVPAVKMRLSRGRALLKTRVTGGDAHD